jgi:ATP-binding cassette, subfamily F, member 3
MISVQNLSKSYGDQVVFDDSSFLMTPGERLGFVGRNGHGKTTLFRILMGDESPDDGTIVLPKGYRIGHLSQHLEFHEATVLDEVLTVLNDRVAEEGYRAEAALMGLGFSKEDLKRPASEFSGGYQIRINLARVLVEEPNLLLLDEPTNYLDIVSVRWLTRFLRKWRNELILITHDRQFMDSVSTHTMAVHRRKLRRMEGSVEKLYGQIFMEEEIHESARANEQKKRKQEERFIERFRSKASKASLVKSRIKALERRGQMDALETERDLSFRFNAAPFHSSIMMSVDELEFGFPEGPSLIDKLDFTIEKGDRVAIIGPNGKGKTTLLNLLAQEFAPRQGVIKQNPNTQIAYFGQTNIARLNTRNTIEEELLAVHPDKSRTAVRTLCGLLMFSGDSALKSIDVLSGGERSRVLLGKLLVSPANLLLLDEPTNHLDIESIEGLLDAVDGFPGSVLLVTHSEMILERLATRLIVFDGGKVSLFQGGYRDFLDRVGWSAETQDRSGGQHDKDAGSPKPRKSRDTRRKRAEIVTARSKATKPLKNKINKLEKEIVQLEQEVKEHEQQMGWAASDGRNEDLAKQGALAAGKRRSIETNFEKLESVSEELDRASAKFDTQLKELD